MIEAVAFQNEGYQRLFQQKLMSSLARLTWTEVEIAQYRTQRLRTLLSYAKQHSAWYRERLARVDIDAITADDLSAIPPMTKVDMLEYWDGIVTEPSLSYQRCQEFVLNKGSAEPLLDQRYHIWASGGSSGQRGLYVWTDEEFAEFSAAMFRWRLRDAKGIELTGAGLKRVVIQPNKGIHITPALFTTKIYPNDNIALLPANAPLAQMVEQLNQYQPTHIEGYPSIVFLLAQQQLLGNLAINPIRICTNSEVLTQDMRDVMSHAWGGVPINNHWGSTDSGSHGINCDYSYEQHLQEDLNIIEAVSNEGHAVTVGEKTDKIYTTCLYNFSFPLIRYELTDQITISPHACGCGARYACIENVAGRQDDDFIYANEIIVRPNSIVNGHVMLSKSVSDYQVFQTEKGMRLNVIYTPAANQQDLSKLQSAIEKELNAQGLSMAVVDLVQVDELERHPETDKLKRFLPLVR